MLAQKEVDVKNIKLEQKDQTTKLQLEINLKEFENQKQQEKLE